MMHNEYMKEGKKEGRKSLNEWMNTYEYMNGHERITNNEWKCLSRNEHTEMNQ